MGRIQADSAHQFVSWEKMMSIIVSLVVFLTLIFGAPKSEPLNTFSAKFNRTFVEHNKKEVVEGTIYYQAPNKVVTEIDTPIEQIMAVIGKAMLIYYPNEKKAFRIKSKNPIPPPFIQTIIGSMKDDYGLIELGYALVRHEKKGDTIYTHWKPPSKHKKVLGMFILGTAPKNKIVSAETHQSNGRIAIKSVYRKHITFGERYIPREIFTEYYDKSGITQEHVIFSDVKFNPSLPDRVLNFKIPDSIPIKEVEF